MSCDVLTSLKYYYLTTKEVINVIILYPKKYIFTQFNCLYYINKRIKTNVCRHRYNILKFYPIHNRTHQTTNRSLVHFLNSIKYFKCIFYNLYNFWLAYLPGSFCRLTLYLADDPFRQALTARRVAMKNPCSLLPSE